MATSAVVSVVVPVRDGAAVIGDCLTAIASQRGAPAYEVVVVDNGSTDATADIVRQRHPDVRLVCEQWPGSYAARNAGIRAAAGEIVAFTDADCTPQPGWLAAACAAIDAGADLVGGGIAMHRSARPTVAERYDRAVYLRQQDLVRHHGWAVTANLVVRRSVFDALGLFDPTLPSGGDRDLCLRAGTAGFRLVYAPEAVVGHRPRTRVREIWRVNRRIGTGMRRSHPEHDRRGYWRSAELRQPLEWVVQCVAEDGPPLRRRQLAGVHTIAMAGRWIGLLTGR
jgi:glycosyltransferase involved in cell wall biosynthesis